jgi:hypothetical protein
MVHVNIPTEVEAAVNEAAAQKLVNSLANEIAQEVESKVKAYTPVNKSTVIDGEWLLQCLDNELQRRKGESDLFHSAINRPDVFLATRQGQKYVRTFGDLMTFCSSIAAEDISLEREYTGWDHKEVVVLRVRIPSHYMARVAYIRMRHIPKRFLTSEDSVLIKMLPPKNKKFDRGELAILCRELQPVWTDRALFEVKKEVIQLNYHFVTFKIRKEDHTVKSWFPGIDKNCTVCGGIDDDFVLVGQQYHHTERQVKPALTLGDLE